MPAASLPLLLLSLLAPPAFAQEDAADTAEAAAHSEAITIDGLRSVESGGRIHIDAQASFTLPPSLVAALDKEEDLVFVTDIQVLREREFLPAAELVDVQINRRLTFHALTRNYIVNDLTFSKQMVFPSLDEALEYLGRYRDVSVVEKLLAVGSGATHMRMRVRLSRSHLPPLLHARSLVSPDWWRMSSIWYRWRL